MNHIRVYTPFKLLGRRATSAWQRLLALALGACAYGAAAQFLDAVPSKTNAVASPSSKANATDWGQQSLPEVKQAAEQGDASAQFALGWRFENGSGMPRNYTEAAKFYHLAAEQGHAMAQNNLGYLCFRGLGVPKDTVEAVKWYRKSAEQGEAFGQANLGWMYERGLGVEKNRERAEAWIRKAAEQGFVEAQFLMGSMAERNGVMGNTVVGNYQVASEWYQKAAAQGHVKAMFQLGELYYYGKLGHNHPEAAKWFRQAAEKGSHEAVMRLGELYSSNHGDLPANSTEASRWYRVAAEQGNAEAQYQLGCLLADRKDNPDFAQAERWWRKAVENGYAEAAIRLVRLNTNSSDSVMTIVSRAELEVASYRGGGEARLPLARAYEEGRGGDVNLPAAAETYWRILNLGPRKDQSEAARRLINLYAQKKLGFDASAVYGPKDRESFAKLLRGYSPLVTSAQAQFQVGEMFLRGETLPADKPEAVQWLTRAAQTGSAPAMNRLGELWAAGLGGSPDAKEAAKWYQRAATKGLALAQFHLGCAFEKGEGVTQDYVEASAWLMLAAQQGLPEARGKITAIEAKFSPGQIEAAKGRASELIKNLPPKSSN